MLGFLTFQISIHCNIFSETFEASCDSSKPLKMIVNIRNRALWYCRHQRKFRFYYTRGYTSVKFPLLSALEVVSQARRFSPFGSLWSRHIYFQTRISSNVDFFKCRYRLLNKPIGSRVLVYYSFGDCFEYWVLVLLNVLFDLIINSLFE